jgi:cytochrome b561
MAARSAHGAMYAALILLPSMALLRSIGSGRGVALFGLEFLAPTGQKIPALMAPANAVHGLFGWIFLGLIVGHTAMALFHHYVVQDGTLGKMIPILLRK